MSSWHKDSIITSLDRLCEEHNKKVAELTAKVNALSVQCTYNQPIKYPDLPTINKGYTNHRYSSDHTPEQLQKKLDEAEKEAEIIKEKNLKTIQENKLVIISTTHLLEKLGIPKTHNVKKGRKYVNETSPPYLYIQMQIPTSDGLSYFTQRLGELRKSLQSLITQNENDLKAELRKQENAKEKRQKDLQFATVLLKYSMDPSTTPEEALDNLLGKDKYLHLAHYLAKNRGDWNDGPSYAEGGLNNFTVETDEDVEIHSEISGLVYNWGGDGRCFRDCEYNYNYLYGLVPADLMESYNIVNELVIM